MIDKIRESNKDGLFCDGTKDGGCSLILTASVRPASGTPFTCGEREAQYIRSLRFYAKFFRRNSDWVHRVFFIENSGYDCSKFAELLPSDVRDSFHFVCFPASSSVPEKGRSWNEMKTLDSFFDQLDSSFDDELFFKATGRYPIHNLDSLLRCMVHACGGGESVALICEPRRFFHPHPAFADVRLFGFTKQFWQNRLRGRYTLANEMTAINFEKLAYDEVVRRYIAIRRIRQPLVLARQSRVRRLFSIPIPHIFDAMMQIGMFLAEKRLLVCVPSNGDGC